jgi:hypothetical protein
MGFGPLAHWPISPVQPPRLGLTQPARTWVGQTDPDLPRPLSSPRPRWRLDHRRCRLATLAISGGQRRRHHGQNAPLSTLFLLHRTDSVAASSVRRFVTGSHSGYRLSVAADFTCRRTASLGMLCVLAVVQVCVCMPVEAPDTVLPVVPR